MTPIEAGLLIEEHQQVSRKAERVAAVLNDFDLLPEMDPSIYLANRFVDIPRDLAKACVTTVLNGLAARQHAIEATFATLKAPT